MTSVQPQDIKNLSLRDDTTMKTGEKRKEAETEFEVNGPPQKITDLPMDLQGHFFSFAQPKDQIQILKSSPRIRGEILKAHPNLYLVQSIDLRESKRFQSRPEYWREPESDPSNVHHWSVDFFFGNASFYKSIIPCLHYHLILSSSTLYEMLDNFLSYPLDQLTIVDNVLPASLDLKNKTIMVNKVHLKFYNENEDLDLKRWPRFHCKHMLITNGKIDDNFIESIVSMYGTRKFESVHFYNCKFHVKSYAAMRQTDHLCFESCLFLEKEVKKAISSQCPNIYITTCVLSDAKMIENVKNLRLENVDVLRMKSEYVTDQETGHVEQVDTFDNTQLKHLKKLYLTRLFLPYHERRLIADFAPNLEVLIIDDRTWHDHPVPVPSTLQHLWTSDSSVKAKNVTKIINVNELHKRIPNLVAGIWRTDLSELGTDIATKNPEDNNFTFHYVWHRSIADSIPANGQIPNNFEPTTKHEIQSQLAVPHSSADYKAFFSVQ